MRPSRCARPATWRALRLPGGTADEGRVFGDWSWRAVELQREYHKYQGVNPGEDHQFIHHMETLTLSLVHDGRFDDAKKIKSMPEGSRNNFRPMWLRMALAQRDWDEAQKLCSNKFGSVQAKGPAEDLSGWMDTEFRYVMCTLYRSDGEKIEGSA